MPERKPARKTPPVPVPIVRKPPARVGLPTRLAAIQERYRRALIQALDQPPGEQGGHIRAALATLLTEKAALGVRDGEEAASVSE